MSIVVGPSVYGSGFTGGAAYSVTVPETLVAGDLIAICAVSNGTGNDGSRPSPSDDVGGANVESDGVQNVQVNGLGVVMLLWEIVTGWGPTNQITLTWDGPVDAIIACIPIHGAANGSVSKTGNDTNPDTITVGSTARMGIYTLAASGATTAYPFNDGGVTDIGDDFNDTPSGISLALGQKVLAGGDTIDVAGTPDVSTQTMQAFLALVPATPPPVTASPMFGHVISLT